MLIRHDRSDELAAYATVPIAFMVNSRLDLRALDEDRFVEIPEEPWAKDYDAIEGEGPRQWMRQFDLANWKIFAAWQYEQRVGGAVVAWNTPGVDMLEGRSDIAVLWDIRVSPNHRGKGVGSALFGATVGWAKSKGCVELKVETQDINVAACRFYRSQGCRLSEINPDAYELPETQLIWRLALM